MSVEVSKTGRVTAKTNINGIISNDAIAILSQQIINFPKSMNKGTMTHGGHPELRTACNLLYADNLNCLFKNIQTYANNFVIGVGDKHAQCHRLFEWFNSWSKNDLALKPLVGSRIDNAKSRIDYIITNNLQERANDILQLPVLNYVPVRPNTLNYDKAYNY